LKKYFLLSLFLADFTFAREVNGATVESVYTHDCCGRGPYTAVVLNAGKYSGSGACHGSYDNVFAIEVSHPNHDAFVSIALSANASGKKVNVYGNRAGCIGPFNRADGISITNL